ncbi:MAG: hypothetical protein Q7R39_14695 [Dehalococcoidia bacterium]|nr:hypothetical protein [Dehalococcoidia bacterium]
MGETPLAQALAREDFDSAARCLLAGVARALEKLPPDSLEGMLDAITGRKDGPEARRRKAAKKSL